MQIINRYLSLLAVITLVTVVAVTAYRASIESVDPETVVPDLKNKLENTEIL